MRLALDSGRPLSELTDEEILAASAALEPAAFRALLAEESSLESKLSAGGTARERLVEQLAAARAAISAR